MMLGITSHVDGRTRNVTRSELALSHVVGGILGGATLGLTLVVVREIAAALFTSVVLVGVVVAVCALSIAADLRKARLPARRQQVPATWVRRFGERRAFLAYGFVLGLGVRTFAPYAAMYSALVVALVTRDAGQALGLGIAFGAGRSVSVVLASRWLEAASRLFYRDVSMRWIARSLSALTSAAIALVSVATAIWGSLT
jgi:hypothetical protein